MSSNVIDQASEPMPTRYLPCHLSLATTFPAAPRLAITSRLQMIMLPHLRFIFKIARLSLFRHVALSTAISRLGPTAHLMSAYQFIKPLRYAMAEDYDGDFSNDDEMSHSTGPARRFLISRENRELYSPATLLLNSAAGIVRRQLLALYWPASIAPRRRMLPSA